MRERPTGRDGRVTAEVQGLTEVKILNIDEMMAFFKRCTVNRSTSSTKLNDNSSRSHAIFTISLSRTKVELLGETDANFKV